MQSRMLARQSPGMVEALNGNVPWLSGVADCVSTSDRPMLVEGDGLKLRPYAGFGLAPKIAVPTRTQVEPSSMATSKSCDMPMESTSI
jgi:hypothetical protein